MRRIYLAGAYSATSTIAALDNIRRGIRAATEVLLAGDAPFCPWLDHQFVLALREGEALTASDLFAASLEWLKSAEAVVVLPGADNSVGAQKEIKIAEERGIPVYTLAEWLENKKPLN